MNHYHNFGDWALLRRELFEKGFLARNAAKGLYWKAETACPGLDSVDRLCLYPPQ